VAEVVVEFGASQSIGALREAAYRLIGEASCLIDTTGGRHVCRLTPKAAQTDEAIRTRFLDLVTDENLREKIAAQTAPIRDVIVALAFGALARERDGSGSG
jgi:His-Xaa-Ser system protein HxsD